ncbi:hypothetical protein FOZ63_027830 [Perkinsus olseni]|nr:hypothetical protein FOZ63_027830 [Perkinsus olseni]
MWNQHIALRAVGKTSFAAAVMAGSPSAMMNCGAPYSLPPARDRIEQEQSGMCGYGNQPVQEEGPDNRER